MNCQFASDFRSEKIVGGGPWRVSASSVAISVFWVGEPLSFFRYALLWIFSD